MGGSVALFTVSNGSERGLDMRSWGRLNGSQGGLDVGSWGDRSLFLEILDFFLENQEYFKEKKREIMIFFLKIKNISMKKK